MSYKKQIIYSGFGSYQNIKSIIKKIGALKPLLVCSNTYNSSFLKEYFESLNLNIVYFSDYSPNPCYEDILKGIEVFKKENCDLLISVGGGSTIDVAKCIKLFSSLPEESDYLKGEYTDNGVLHLCIPTTAGSGSESTKFAVFYKDGEKQSVTSDSIIPEFVVLEPEFLKTLSDYQRRATVLDALCQAIESLWSVNSTEESIEYAKTAIRTILANLYGYLSNDEDALTNISVASNYSGQAINISRTTAPHAMSYKLTTKYGFSHGHSVAVSLAYVWRYMIEHTEDCIDKRGKEWLENIFETLDELFYVDKHHQSVYRFFRLLKYLGIEFPKLKEENDIESLASSVNVERLKNNPVKLEKEALLEIYSNIFNVGNQFDELYIDKFLRKYRTCYEVKELQGIALDALKKVDSICKKQNIEYYFTEGTLLGAVRHNGFIPWDDDVDICMKREEYKKFIAIAPSELGEDYVLDCFETNPKHWTICAKVLLKRKTKFINKRLEGIGLSTSPGIDIFPLDDAPMNNKKCQILEKIITLFKIMLWQRTGYSHDYGSIKYALLKVASLFVTPKFLHKIINGLMQKNNGKGSSKLINYGSLYSANRETYPKSCFDKAQNISFENYNFPIPCGYDEILRITYGEYESLPPFSKRFPKHSFLVDKTSEREG